LTTTATAQSTASHPPAHPDPAVAALPLKVGMPALRFPGKAATGADPTGADCGGPANGGRGASRGHHPRCG